MWGRDLGNFTIFFLKLVNFGCVKRHPKYRVKKAYFSEFRSHMSRLLSFVDELLQDSSKLVDFITDPEGV